MVKLEFRVFFVQFMYSAGSHISEWIDRRLAQTFLCCKVELHFVLLYTLYCYAYDNELRVTITAIYILVFILCFGYSQIKKIHQLVFVLTILYHRLNNIDGGVYKLFNNILFKVFI